MRWLFEKSQLNPNVSVWRLWMNTALCCYLELLENIFTFALYSQALAHQMEYSSIGVQFIYNFSYLGYSIGGLIVGAFMDVGGPFLVFGIATVLHLSGYLLSAFAIDKAFYCPDYLMWLFALMYGTGQGVVYVSGFVVNTRNFPIEVRGKILGVTAAFSGGANIALSLIWDNVFMNDPNNYDPEGQPVAAYFRFLAILVGGSCAVAACFVRVWDLNEPALSKSTSREYFETPNVVCESDSESHDHYFVYKLSDYSMTTVAKSNWKFLRVPSYLYVLTVYCIFKGVERTYIGEIGRIGESLKMTNIVPNHVIIQSVAVVLTRFAVGYFYDKNRTVIPTWVYLLFCLLLGLLMSIALAIDVEFMYKYYLCTVGFGIAAMLYFLVPLLIANRYGKYNMANAFAVMIMLSTMVTFAYAAWGTEIYNNNRNGDPENGENELRCYGDTCLQTSFLISAATVAFAILLLVWKGRESDIDHK